MHKTKLSKSDIGVAILILTVSFVGIPFFAWLYSNWRANEVVRKITPEIKYMIESNLPDTELLIKTIVDEHELRTVDEKAGKKIHSYPYSSSSYKESKRLAGKACDVLSGEIKNSVVFKEAVAINEYYYSSKCSFDYVPADGHHDISISRSSYNEQDNANRPYKEHLDEMLRGSDKLSISIYPDKNKSTIHVTALLHRDPILVWDITLYKGRRYSGGKGGY